MVDRDYFEEDENRIIYKYKSDCFYKIKIDDMNSASSSFLSEIVENFIPNENIVNVVVDLENVKYLDSTSVGIFISMKKTAEDREKKLKMVNIGPSIRTLLCIIGLDEYFDVTDEYFRFPIHSIEDKK